jgi:hypothetical protein
MFTTLAQEIHDELFGQIGKGFFSIKLDRSGSYNFPTVQDLEITGNYVDATVFGDILGDLTIENVADWNTVTVFGNVYGDVVNDDGWYNNVSIQGHISGDLDIEFTRGGSFSGWSVDDISAYNSSGFSYDFGSVDLLDLYRVDNSTGKVGVLEEGEVAGDNNDVFIFQLDDVLEVDSGDNNSIQILNANSAKIEVEDDATNTDINVQYGDVEVEDDGHNSHIRLGAGNDDVTVGDDASGTTLINGGAGWDVLDAEGGDTIIFNNFEQVNTAGAGQNAELVALDGIVSGYEQVGDVFVNRADLMSMFGFNDGHGNAVLDRNGEGSFTAIGAADNYQLPFETPQQQQYDDLSF